MDEKDKDLEQSIRKKIEAIGKKQFMLGMLAGNRAAMEIMWQHSKDMTSANILAAHRQLFLIVNLDALEIHRRIRLDYFNIMQEFEISADRNNLAIHARRCHTTDAGLPTQEVGIGDAGFGFSNAIKHLPDILAISRDGVSGLLLANHIIHISLNHCLFLLLFSDAMIA